MDGRDWQELMQQLLLEIQKTNQEQLQILGELKACVNSIKKRQDKNRILRLKQKLDKHLTKNCFCAIMLQVTLKIKR